MNMDQERYQILTQILGMDGRKIIKRLENIQLSVLHDKEHLLVTNPSWNILTDARIRSINTLFSSLRRTGLGFVFLNELLDNDWFQLHSPTSTRELKIDQVVSFEKLVKYNFGMDFFTCIETSFRIFLRVLEPNACNSGTGPFKNVYEFLLGPNLLNFQDDERPFAIELINLSRLLRNLIHNSGVYFSNDGRNEIASYKGKIYTFRHGKPIDFMYWEFLLEITDDIHKLLGKVISHPRIEGIPHILDPYCI